MALLRAVQHVAWSYRGGPFLEAVERTSPAHRIVVLALCGVVTTAGTFFVRHAVRGRARSLSESIWFDSGRLPVAHSMANAVLSIVVVALGASLGREAAPKEFGAALASTFSKWFGVTPAERRLLVACGAGAGMAAVYNVPLGGALFSVEVLLGTLALPLVLPALLTSLVATAISWIGLPHAPTYSVPHYHWSYSAVVWAILFGPLAGLASVAYIRGVALAGAMKPKGSLAYVVPVVFFTSLGIVACAFPQVLGNGGNIAQLTFVDHVSVELLAALVAAKFIATIGSLWTGAPGGLFTPTIAFGALLGGLLGHAWTMLWPEGQLGMFAIIGAGALLAATTQGPISSLVLLLELTYRIDALMVPLMLAITGATIVARRLDSRSVYSARTSTSSQATERLLGSAVLSGAASYSAALERFARAPHLRLFVIDEASRYLGTITCSTLFERPLSPMPIETTTASDLAQPSPSLTAEMSAAEVARVFDAVGGTLPLVAARSQILLDLVHAEATHAVYTNGSGKVLWQTAR